jgi:tetratricopeptide (TPR) repeat protein
MDTLKEQKNWPEMPYPGLRPFEISKDGDESLIFFGRQQQIYELVDRLAESHLVAVIGPSGCGKSSLVRVGLIPALEAGYLYRAGTRWLTTTMEPGGYSTKALAKALSNAVAKADAINGPNQIPKTPLEFEKQLNRRPDALVELSEELAPVLGERTNLLILIDQFEELFRKDMTPPADATRLINMILNVFHARPDRLYIVITMRTDYLEQCAYYRGLPEALNQTHYLTPRLNDEELREAITKPVELEHFGGSIEPALIRQLLYEMSDEVTYDPDYLPLMQHALAWMWQTSEHHAGENKTKPVLKLIDYKKFDGLAGSLSEHANKILNNLTATQQKIAEDMFRLLSDYGHGGRITRRVTTPERIAAVAGVSKEDVGSVIEAFTDKESCFVRWKDNQTRLDVTHESLIRKWNTLKEWVKEEARSAEMYRKIEQTALSWKEKKASLLTGLELQNALEWEKNVKPTGSWAKRYGNDFGLVQEFLEKSKKKERLRRTFYYSAMVVIILSIIAFPGWFLWKIGSTYTEAGQLDQIRKMGTRIILEQKNISDSDLKQWARAQAYGNNSDEATEVLKLIKNEDKRKNAVIEVFKIFAKMNNFKATVRVAENQIDQKAKVDALEDAALELARAEKADQALKVAELIKNEEDKNWALVGVAEALARAERVGDARQVVERIKNQEAKDDALVEVAVALARAQRADEALEVVKLIDTVDVKNQALVEMATGLARAERADEALKAAELITKQEYKNQTLVEVAVALAKARRADEALKVIETINNEDARDDALSKVAEKLAQTVRTDEALKVTELIINEETKADALRIVAEELTRAVRIDDARQVVERIKNQEAKDDALVEVAVALARAQGADEALKVVEIINNGESKDDALSEVAKVIARARRVDNALKVVERINNQVSKDNALVEVAEALAQAQGPDEALKVAELINNENAKGDALTKVALALAIEGRAEKARQVAESIYFGPEKPQVLRRVAMTLAEIGKFTEAQRIAEGISETEEKDIALKHLAEALARDRTRNVADAWQVADLINKEETKNEALDKMAVDLAKEGRTDEAQRVAEHIYNQQAKNEALGKVAGFLSKLNKVEDAHRVAKMIDDSAIESKDEALTSVAEAFANLGNLSLARETAKGISDSAKQLNACSIVLIIYATNKAN